MTPTADEIAYWRTMHKPHYPGPQGDLNRELWYFARILKKLEEQLASNQDKDADQTALDQYVLSQIEKTFPSCVGVSMRSARHLLSQIRLAMTLRDLQQLRTRLRA